MLISSLQKPTVVFSSSSSSSFLLHHFFLLLSEEKKRNENVVVIRWECCDFIASNLYSEMNKTTRKEKALASSVSIRIRSIDAHMVITSQWTNAVDELNSFDREPDTVRYNFLFVRACVRAHPKLTTVDFLMYTYFLFLSINFCGGVLWLPLSLLNAHMPKNGIVVMARIWCVRLTHYNEGRGILYAQTTTWHSHQISKSYRSKPPAHRRMRNSSKLPNCASKMFVGL